ncbi:MAG TPA: discoidin domain-containing protein [Prolixibacteraceae bacterium]|nr:discoidin domain-containing protein [Prolixibacteraceae bacterium]
MKPKNTINKVLLTGPVLVLFLLLNACSSQKMDSVPETESERFAESLQTAPILVADPTHRNIALNRPAEHSSSWNYNLTAQLLTDGIIDPYPPLWIKTENSRQGLTPKEEREYPFDRHPMTGTRLDGRKSWIKLESNLLAGIGIIDSLSISGSLTYDETKPKGWKIILSASERGIHFEPLIELSGIDYPGNNSPDIRSREGNSNYRIFNEGVKLKIPARSLHYRLDFVCESALTWNITEIEFFYRERRNNIGGPYAFSSAWKSEGSKNEWVSVDLGKRCPIDSVLLFWVNPAADFSIELSNDGTKWNSIQRIENNRSDTSRIRMPANTYGQYARILMTRPVDPGGYALHEVEIYGEGAPKPKARPNPPVDENGRLFLSGGKWKVQRSTLVEGTAWEIAQAGYDDSKWIPATVPGTILMSYCNAGILPDPNFSDNQLMISESFFYSDFWYRNEFQLPKSFTREKTWLHFDGINWKADVFLNGEKLGRIEGAFQRTKYEISQLLKPGQSNYLAVKIMKNDHPGYTKEQTRLTPQSNGGELGADNPTFHASVGWDWMPTIRGRNTGIWNDVYLTQSGPVTLEHPFVYFDLPLPDTSFALINLELFAQNGSNESISGTLKGSIGAVHFDYPVRLEAGKQQKIVLNADKIPELKMMNPILWWPNGYGNPHLYEVQLLFRTDNGIVSDELRFKTGIREMNYSEENGILNLYINGRRFSGRGGNWGFSESNLKYRSLEYDIAVNYHKDMHFTLIRNWVGQTADEEFFEACDRHGIMIWQDFWLANPVDGPNPFSHALFRMNALDFVRKIRNHPSLALYCGRNEGNPPPELDAQLKSLVGEYHPGLRYIAHSARGEVSGYGPYRAMPPDYYFRERALPTLHSEMGMPNMVNKESLIKMLPDTALWPQNRLWGIHDFCLKGAQGAESFNHLIDTIFGPVVTLDEWIRLAQYVNYQGYRAMFEAQSKHRAGLLLWMSHPAWPSMVWQTYDYYFDPTAAYFGCKKGSEPLHIQWNAYTDSIEVMNTSFRNGTGLTARIEVFNLDGSQKFSESIPFNSREDSRLILAPHPRPQGLSEVYFLRLRIEKGKQILRENLYWRALNGIDLSAVQNVPPVKLNQNTIRERKLGKWLLTTTLENPSPHPALMARLKVVGEQSGERILPALFSDNYLTLLPGTKTRIEMEVNERDTRGELPVVVVDGINIEQ